VKKRQWEKIMPKISWVAPDGFHGIETVEEKDVNETIASFLRQGCLVETHETVEEKDIDERKVFCCLPGYCESMSLKDLE
jgi:hypothetical protein